MREDGRDAAPMLLVLAGLPGSGKSTVAHALAVDTGWPLLAVDAVDDAIRRAGVDPAEPTGLAAYVVVEALAESQLARGGSVVVDAVNDASQARQQWELLVGRTDARLLAVEVVCDDEATHRSRLSGRRRAFTHLPEPTWQSVVDRRDAWQPWGVDTVVVDGTGPATHAVSAVRRRLEAIRAG